MDIGVGIEAVEEVEGAGVEAEVAIRQLLKKINMNKKMTK